MKVVKFGCPDEADPQPLYCEVPNAVPGGQAAPRGHMVFLHGNGMCDD